MKQLGFWATLKQILFTKRYYDFDGVSTRREFRYFLLFVFLYILFYIPSISILIFVRYGLGFCYSWFENSECFAFSSALFIILAIMLLSFYLLIPLLAVCVRRLHDMGWSGWWIALILVFIYYGLPILGYIILIIFPITSFLDVIFLLMIFLGMVFFILLGLPKSKLSNNKYRPVETNTSSIP